MDPPDTSDRSRGVALALSSMLGIFGCHRFYVGKIGTGLLQLFTLGGFSVWYLYDLILVASGNFRDADGRRLANWGETDTTHSAHHLTDERVEMLLDEFDIGGMLGKGCPACAPAARVACAHRRDRPQGVRQRVQRCAHADRQDGGH